MELISISLKALRERERERERQRETERQREREREVTKLKVRCFTYDLLKRSKLSCICRIEHLEKVKLYLRLVSSIR